MRALSFSLVLWAFSLLSVHAQTGFNGTFLAVVDDMSCRFAVKTTYNTINGTYDEGGFSLQVIGTFSGRQASGDLKDPALGTVVATFKAVLQDNNTLDLTFFLGAEKRSHAFLREGIPPKPKKVDEKLTYDPRLTGNWSYQVITGGNGAGFQTVFYFQLSADGRYAQYSKSVGGGTDWSYDSGKVALQQQGLWHSYENVLYIKPEGQADYTAAATYRFVSGKLVTDDVSGQKIWVRD